MTKSNEKEKGKSFKDFRTQWAALAVPWLRCLHAPEGEDYTVDLPSHADAINLRSKLYAAIRRARKPRFYDSELVRAGELCSVNVSGRTLTVYKRTLHPVVEIVKELDEQKSVEESLASLSQLLVQADNLTKGEWTILPEDSKRKEEAPKCDISVNPYFVRERED